ncbi:MAG: hypothetical protein R3D67_20190 [Hyphomicrobiaceae bacterium]
MSELDPKAVYLTLKEDSKQGPLARPLLVARVIAIAMAVGGAVPTAMTLYQSWVHGIPYSEVSHRLKQYDMWVKNFDCKVDYRALTTAQGTRVDAGACGRTGDVAIKVTAPGGKAAYEWIAFAQLQKSGQAAASVWQVLGSSAFAAEPPAPREGARLVEDQGTSGGRIGAGPAAVASGRVQIAQATQAAPSGMKVLCQAMPSKAMIVRVVQEGAKCYRERVSVFKGSLQKREEVPCTTQCN